MEYFEEPFFRIEMARCEMEKKSLKGAIVGALVVIAVILNLVY